MRLRIIEVGRGLWTGACESGDSGFWPRPPISEFGEGEGMPQWSESVLLISVLSDSFAKIQTLYILWLKDEIWPSLLRSLLSLRSCPWYQGQFYRPHAETSRHHCTTVDLSPLWAFCFWTKLYTLTFFISRKLEAGFLGETSLKG